jgi:hypothetical protein
VTYDLCSCDLCTTIVSVRHRLMGSLALVADTLKKMLKLG